MRVALLLLALPLVLCSCTLDVTLRGVARCDGLKQDSEESVDAPFDADGDGRFDGNNPDCAEVYALLDCDDSNPNVNPGAVEELCDGLDNDCDESTADTEDLDDDGIDACEDCDPMARSSNALLIPL